MTAAITVGFQPAAMPVVGAPGTATATAASAPAGGGDLFAALLAMLTPGADATTANLALPETVVAPLQQGLAKAKALTPEDLEAQLSASAEKLGIDLSALADLLAGSGPSTETSTDPATFANAITRLVQALDNLGEAPSDAEGKDVVGEDKLEAAVDALLDLVGATLPTPTPPPTTGETFKELVGDLTASLTGRDNLSDAPAAPSLPDATTSAGATAPAASAGSVPATDTAPAQGDRPAVIGRLTQLLDKTAEAVAATNPQLAEKLTALARALPTLPDKLLAALEATAGADASDEAAPELATLIELAARARPAQRSTTAPTFAAPTLAVPVPDESDSRASIPETKASDRAPSLDKPDLEPKPATGPASRPESSQPRAASAQSAPAPIAAEAATDTPADQAPVPTGTASAQQPPVAAPAAYRAVQAAYQPPANPINVPQVAFEIVRQFEAGNSRFQIRLDPAELGRIDVQLDVDRAGNVNARMVVERPETLDLMQRDHRSLQQALQQAGLDANRTNLEFSLRQNPFAGDGASDGRHQGQSGRQGGDALGGEGATDPIPDIYRGTAAPGALNLFV